MKKLFVSILIAFSTLAAGAQDMFNDPQNQSQLGLRLNYDLTCPTEVTFENNPGRLNTYGNGSGFSIEAFYSIPLWKNLYFEPAAALFYNTMSINETITEHALLSGSTRQFGMRIPLNIGYRFDLLEWLSISVFTGPEIDLALYNRAHFNENNLSYVGNSKKLNATDIKWRFGVGATFNKRYQLAISGAAGICDMCAETLVVADTNSELNTTANMKMRANLFTISLGYLF